MTYLQITEEEAKKMYCEGHKVYVTTNKRTHWKMPSSYEYCSHAPAEELFNRSIPKYEGGVGFFKTVKELSNV